MKLDFILFKMALDQIQTIPIPKVTWESQAESPITYIQKLVG